MIGSLLLNGRLIGVGALALAIAAGGFWGGYKVGRPIGYRAGWDEGREALSIETTMALQEKNNAAADADRELQPCLRDPECLRADDGWRIDRAH